MITIAVGDIDEHWPEAEKALAKKEEVILTREGQAVARLTQVDLGLEPTAMDTRERIDPDENRKWQEEVFGKGLVFHDIDELLRKDRDGDESFY